MCKGMWYRWPVFDWWRWQIPLLAQPQKGRKSPWWIVRCDTGLLRGTPMKAERFLVSNVWFVLTRFTCSYVYVLSVALKASSRERLRHIRTEDRCSNLVLLYLLASSLVQLFPPIFVPWPHLPFFKTHECKTRQTEYTCHGSKKAEDFFFLFSAQNNVFKILLSALCESFILLWIPHCFHFPVKAHM